MASQQSSLPAEPDLQWASPKGGGKGVQMIPLLRIVLALSSQLVVFTRQEEFIHGYFIISAALGLYALYAIWLYVRGLRSSQAAATLKSFAHWGDAMWCILLISLSGGGSSIFFIGFLFPILVASFRWGFFSGLNVTLVSVLSFLAIGIAPMHSLEYEFDLKLLALKSAWVLILGYMIANWGESEITLRRRLGFVNDTIGCSNPRFGIDRTVAFLLESLKDFYGAQRSLIILTDSKREEFLLHRSSANGDEATSYLDTIAPEMARPLLELTPDYAAVYNARTEGWWHSGRVHHLLDITFDRVTNVKRSRFAALAEILGGKSFVTVPFKGPNLGTGRLYVVAARPAFVPSDMHFLLRFLDQMNPILDNIRLIEQLAEHAADDERHRIARDIHDSVIQPYFGLQMGLEAIRDKTMEHLPDVSAQIDKLVKIADTGITDLRSYVTGLKEKGESDGGLVPAMRCFAARFSELTGIGVEIETHGDILANERLAAEAFQMMREGLSNIRKHTRAERAKVLVTCSRGHLVLEIMNDNYRGVPTPFFKPASLSERAVALGGTVRIKNLDGGGNSVVVDIPL